MEIQGDILFVAATGDFDMDGLAGLIDAVAEKCQETGVDKVFCDVQGIPVLPLGVGQYLLGRQAADRLWRHVRRAVLFNLPERINGFFQNVASNRGLRVLGTNDRDAAMRYLEDTSSDD